MVSIDLQIKFLIHYPKLNQGNLENIFLHLFELTHNQRW